MQELSVPINAQPSTEQDTLAGRGLACTLHHGGLLAVYTLRKPAGAAIDAWAAASIQRLAHLPAGQPAFALVDLSAIPLSMAPYLAQRLRDIHHAAPRLRGQYALVLKETRGARLARRLLERWLVPQEGDFSGEIVFDRDAAFLWLEALALGVEF